MRRRELTAERFIAPPPGADGDSLGGLFYRTGDLARWDDVAGAGNGRPLLICRGRIDSQVKLRGYRLELGEIEAAALFGVGVSIACAAIHDAPAHEGIDINGHQQLLLYVAPAAARPSDIRASLRAHLPSYMIPNVVISVEAMPLSSSGKLLRAALPSPNTEGAETPPSAHDALDSLGSLSAHAEAILGLPLSIGRRGDANSPELLVQLPRMGDAWRHMDDDDLVSVWSSIGRLPLATPEGCARIG